MGCFVAALGSWGLLLVGVMLFFTWFYAWLFAFLHGFCMI